jgi:flagellar biogenesis protein FliO
VRGQRPHLLTVAVSGNSVTPHPDPLPSKGAREKTFVPRLSVIANRSKFALVPVFIFSFLSSALAETNSAAVPFAPPGLPEAVPSLLRVAGALMLVIALFLGGVWLVRNWQRVGGPRGRAPKLSVFETRSLGGRHSVFVVGYERERFLIASSPGGVNLISHLPAAAESETEAEAKTAAPPSFAQALQLVLKGKGK